MAGNFTEVHKRSIEDREGFWAEVAEGIDWVKKWDKVLDDSNAPLYRWFEGGELNTCYNMLDRHVENGRGEQAALIYDSPVTESKRTYSYSELLDLVANFAGALANQGVGKGDRVIIYMPMVPEALVAMAACARLGAVHSVVFGGFAANELATRIDDAGAKLIVSASCGIEPGRIVEYKPLLDQAVEMATHKPNGCIILQRPQCTAAMIEGQDVDWQEAVAAAEPHPCVTVKATDPLYILYTSGTTGQPKGIVRDNGGHAVALNWSMKALYDCDPGDVYWAASDVGWVVGHSYIVYAPLLAGCTSVMYEGKPVGTPDAGAFWRVMAEHKVKSMFTAPTAIRAIKQQDPQGILASDYDLSAQKSQFVAGERCDPDTLEWTQKILGVPVVDHWWQTETGWSIACNCLGIEELPVKIGSPTKHVPGWNLKVLDADGKEVEPGTVGNICGELPLPPGTLPTIWNAEERYLNSYLKPFPGYYMTGDAGYIDEDGYVYVMARTDDIINVAGHRLSTGAMEEVLAGHPEVAECAVIGAADELKGQMPLGFYVLNAGSALSEAQVGKELVALVREKIGPVAAFKTSCQVKRLPKTRSGKILRGTMRDIADGKPYKAPATIDDPVILDEITENLKSIGYPKG